ncbi:MAG: DinB family protein [Geodermatophilaceae bacterium]|nr:DinB family protein [Geodermatophilaceae bacterium]
MDIPPDAKDWTWVLERPCLACGVDASQVSGPAVAAMLRSSAAVWEAELGREEVRVRPSPTTWSALEYGCHVRDVCRRFDARLLLMLSDDDPEFETWDQDASAIESRYGTQDPLVVGSELVAAANVLAGHFDAVRGDQWQRTGRRSDGARFTIDSFAAYFLHDILHHLHDIDARSSAGATRSE